MGNEKDAKYYNDVFKSGGCKKMYFKNAIDSIYFPLWQKALDHVTTRGAKIIVDYGCGPGHFAELLYLNCDKELTYYGLDFSSQAIMQAKNRVSGENYHFFEVDLNDFDINSFAMKENIDLMATIVISLEFMEHIEKDLEIINNIPIYTPIIISVPSYDSAGHVRYFQNKKEVINRYQHFMDIDNIETITIKKDKFIFILFGLISKGSQ